MAIIENLSTRQLIDSAIPLTAAAVRERLRLVECALAKDFVLPTFVVLGLGALRFFSKNPTAPLSTIYARV